MKKTKDHYDCISSYDKFYSSNKLNLQESAVLKIPYINQEQVREIKAILHNSHLNIIPIFTPGTKLQKVLTSSTLKPIECNLPQCHNVNCQSKNVIYQLECKVCNEKYIGETKRKLHTRIKEHLRATQLGDMKSAFAEHFSKQHQNIKNIPDYPFNTTIIERADNHTDRLIKEAIWIKKINPKINRDVGWRAFIQ